MNFLKVFGNYKQSTTTPSTFNYFLVGGNERRPRVADRRKGTLLDAALRDSAVGGFTDIKRLSRVQAAYSTPSDLSHSSF